MGKCWRNRTHFYNLGKLQTMARETIRAVIFYTLLIIFTVLLWAAVLFLPKTGQVIYNCTIAEISPDFPLEAREGCRKLRAEAYKK